LRFAAWSTREEIAMGDIIITEFITLDGVIGTQWTVLTG
jgi:hypothetical protein